MSEDKPKIQNSLANYNIFGASLRSSDFTQQLSQTDTIEQNNRNNFISINRQLLSYMYTNYGLVQVLIDQPVDDAFRGGITIKSSQLDEGDIEQIQGALKANDVLKKVKQLAKWTRLYGGGGMVINTVGKAAQPLSIDSIKKDSFLEFYPADLWELSIRDGYQYGEKKPYVDDLKNDKRISYDGESFFFYGQKLSNSRIIKTTNKEAPSFLRPILKGWGMSEAERMVRDLNSKLKNDVLIFELLDEAKVDVVKLEDFNQSMADGIGAQNITQRIQTAMQIKNFQNTLIIDKEDEFEQKQISFAGLSEMAKENRINIASAMRMPITKVFGISSAGFNSGEDEIENYNSMIESEIRGEFDNVLVQIIKILCKKELDFIPDDLDIEYKPLRTLSSEQEQQVKNQELERILKLFDRGLISAETAGEMTNAANLLPNKVEFNEDAFAMPPQNEDSQDAANPNKYSGKIQNSIKKWLKS